MANVSARQDGVDGGTPATEAAAWIWFPAGRTENVFARARRAFDLKAAPRRAEMRIACSGHYRLWVNGTFAARGPAGSTPRVWRYDTLDLMPQLAAGRNVLAVQLLHYGYEMAHSPPTPGGFWCEVEIETASEGRKCIVSDSAWRFALDPAYDPDAGRRNWHYGVIEVYDARQAEDWQAAAFDHSGWTPGVPYAAEMAARAWPELAPRGVPPCREASIVPRAIVRLGEVEDREYSVGTRAEETLGNLAAYLLQDVPLDLEYASVERAESLLEPTGTANGELAKQPAVVRQPSPLDREQPNQRCATIILDFGREITGFGWLDVEGNAGAIVDVAYGERLLGGRVPPVLQSVAYADRYVLRQGRQRHEVYDWKGYRYVQLTFRNLTRPLLVHGVGATFSSYPVEPAGAFDSADPLLTQMWQVGAYTQQLCMHDRLIDCPWREQEQWLGDGRVQLLIIQNVFGDRAMPRKFVEQFAEAQFSDGMLPNRLLGHRTMVDYSLWWVQAVLDVLLFDGDYAFAQRMLPHVARLLAWCEPRLTAEGLLEGVSADTGAARTIFIDWANIGREGICAPLNAIYAIAPRAAVELARHTGHTTDAQRWQARLEQIERAFHDRFWDPQRQLYVDNLIDGRSSGRFSQHTQASAVLAGLCRVDEQALLQRALREEDLVQTEPYFSFYLVEALARAGLAAQALHFLRARWGAMLAQGATTFWEEWQVTGTFRNGRWLARPRSHCHAWSAAPAAWLSRYILGVRVERVGGPIIIAPQSCVLAHAKGTVPTRYGPVHVSWWLEDGRLRLETIAPPDAPVEVQVEV